MGFQHGVQRRHPAVAGRLRERSRRRVRTLRAPGRRRREHPERTSDDRPAPRVRAGTAAARRAARRRRRAASRRRVRSPAVEGRSPRASARPARPPRESAPTAIALRNGSRPWVSRMLVAAPEPPAQPAGRDDAEQAALGQELEKVALGVFGPDVAMPALERRERVRIGAEARSGRPDARRPDAAWRPRRPRDTRRSRRSGRGQRRQMCARRGRDRRQAERQDDGRSRPREQEPSARRRGARWQPPPRAAPAPRARRRARRGRRGCGEARCAAARARLNPPSATTRGDTPSSRRA